jgi:two-component system response regulator PilR (NtrC family)
LDSGVFAEVKDRGNLRGRVLVVDDEQSMREFLSIALERDGHSVEVAENGTAALEKLARESFDLVITDLRLGDFSGLEILQKVRSTDADTEVIVITAYATAENAIKAMKAGAYDYITKPFKVDEIKLICQRALERHTLAQENLTLRQRLRETQGFADIVGKSKAMRQVFDLIAKVAPARTNVLISGESGTGKELVARAIHRRSPRAAKPFVAVNCAAIPSTLLESELFGHTKGAFTGAERGRAGLFREADGGSLLLDEISELDPQLQVKLLRVLQERKIRPVGSDREEQVDVRVMAATNRDLTQCVKDGTFREDLYYRLNVIEVKVPPLRERRDDIALLVSHFVMRFAAESGKKIRAISSDALKKLLEHPFSGNVRELENMVERAVTLASTEVLQAADFGALSAPLDDGLVDLSRITDEEQNLDQLLQRIEHQLIEQALERTEGVRTEAAKLLGISFRSLRYRLDKLEDGTNE